MASDDHQKPWPDPNYHIGQRDHLHALGVIAASYNLLEQSLYFHFASQLGLAPNIAQRLFVSLSNNTRLDLLRNAIEEIDTANPIKTKLSEFLAGFDILAENRNFLMHSHTILNTTSQDHLTFGKGSRNQPSKWNYAHLRLNDLRGVADDIYVYWNFGHALYKWHVASKTGGRLVFSDGFVLTPTLPDTPPLPRKLNLSRYGVLEDALRPPQPSEA